jgi:hypothetical protein
MIGAALERDRLLALTTASTTELARNLNAPDARLWRVAGLVPESTLSPAFVLARVRRICLIALFV